MPVPQQYQDLINAGRKNPLDTYRATYEGALATDIASIAQAQAFLQAELNQLVLTKRNTPLYDVQIIAIEAGPGGASLSARSYDAKQMLEDGFPADKKCRLHYLLNRGSKNAEAPIEEGPTTTTTLAQRFEVRDLIYKYFADSPDKVWDEIKAAVA